MTEKRTHSILIVDDDASFRHGVKRQLSMVRAGPVFEAVEASSGAEAMEILKTRKMDCVLLDHGMPGGSGLDWLSKILQLGGHSAVIMVTGAGSEEIAVKAMKHGVMDYLVKGSITPESLEHAILNALEKIAMKKTIAVQQQKLLDAERHRVMIESLGAACHHVSQPVTVINAYLELMKRQEKSPELQDMINNCEEAAGRIGKILDRLREVSAYRTEPYLPSGDEKNWHDGDSIIAV